MVPFRSARTLVKPKRRNVAAPMMLRVRPAQLMITAGFLRNSEPTESIHRREH